MTQNSQRLPHIALLQTFGVILVIVGHILDTYWYTSLERNWHGFAIPNYSYNFLREYIYTFHMPLFFFISGFLLAYKKYNEKSFIEELKLKFKRIIIPFCLTGLFIYIPTRIFIEPTDTSFNDIPEIFINFFTFVHCSYLWFLPALFITLMLYCALLKTPLKRHLIILTIIILLIRYYAPPLPLSWLIYSTPISYLIFVHMGYIFSNYFQYDGSSPLSRPQIKGTIFSKLYFLLIVLLILNTLANDFMLRIRFVLDPLCKIALFYTISQIISALLPRFTQSYIINYISRNMLVFIFCRNL